MTGARVTSDRSPMTQPVTSPTAAALLPSSDEDRKRTAGSADRRRPRPQEATYSDAKDFSVEWQKDEVEEKRMEEAATEAGPAPFRSGDDARDRERQEGEDERERGGRRREARDQRENRKEEGGSRGAGSPCAALRRRRRVERLRQAKTPQTAKGAGEAGGSGSERRERSS